MKLFLVITITILVTSIVYAQEKIENFNDVKELELSFSLKSTIQLNKIENNPSLEFIKATLSFFPREDYRQRVINEQTSSNPQVPVEREDNTLIFKWTSIDEENTNKIEYGINSKVLTRNEFIKITKEIKFPIRNLDNSLIEYTKATEFIDITPEIEAKAYELIGTETDLYKTVFKIADWTKNNIKYDLSTLTANVVQKSSWVLKNKEGVCDELTNLFISMLRSVGIPARFVSGMVYSNLDYKFGPHGWAEVYFPEYGWIPFDITFGQYGWIDPSHVKLKDDVDSGSPTAEYNWRGYGLDLKVEDIKIETNYGRIGEKFISPLTISIDPYKKSAGPESFVPLLVAVGNPTDYYISTSVVIKKAPELTENNVKQVLLKPKETKTIGWIIKVSENIEEGYIYTAELEATTDYGDMATSQIKYSNEYDYFNKESADKIIESLKERETKSTFTSLQISCSGDKQLYYSNETATIKCQITSQEEIKNFDFCIKDKCQGLSLAPGETKTIEQKFTSIMAEKIAIIAEDNKRVKYVYLDLKVIGVPDLYVTEFRPNAVNFKDDVEITFLINIDTPIKDLELQFEDGNKLVIGDLKDSRGVNIKTNGRSLVNGLKFQAKYRDEGNKEYEKDMAVPVNVKNIPWYAKIILAILDLF